MSDHETAPAMQEEPRLWQKITAGIAGAVLSGAAFHPVLVHESTRLQVGSTQFEISPTLDNYATLNLTPLPNLRYKLDSPLHVGVRAKGIDSVNESVDKEVNTFALIASQAKGEQEKARDAVEGLVWEAAGDSLIIGYGAVGIWALVGRKRRKELVENAAAHRRSVLAAGLAAALVVGVVKAHAPNEPEPIVPNWMPVESLIPAAFNFHDPNLDRLEIEQSGLTTLGQQNLLKAVGIYEQAKTYYGDILTRVPEIADQLRQPKTGEHVAVLVSDRHDNIGMDPVVKAVAKLLHVDMLIDAGDDTSVGGEWEEFSIDSLASNFKDYKYRIVIGGNHDGSGHIMKFYQQKKFTVLNGKPQTIDGIAFLGASDPRETQFNGLLQNLDGSVTDQGEKLMKIACANRHIAVVVAHSPTAANPAAEAGCADLSLSGHLHRQVGPTTYNTPVVVGNLRTSKETATYTNGTTGGAANAFALGDRLGTEAEFTFVTFKNGQPIGLQPVKVKTGGEIVVEPYNALVSDDQAKAEATATQQMHSTKLR